MIYGYIRVSTEMQSYDLQIKALKNCDKIYKETISGVSRHRPELNRLLSDIQAGDTLIVYKLDRLGRSVPDLYDIMRYLKENNITFKSATDQINTDTAAGKMFFGLLAVFAEFERDLISERTIAALKTAKSNGIKLGKPYKWDEKTVKQVLKMRKKGKKVNYISKELNIPRSTIYKLLSVRNSN